ncbi:unannotated protein [freshwater metagenome]|uniref:Unannotated protein n=1 Tax=freshwater metagenome TaxID=449393 RepID=A0A6J6YP18_9ZZZZ
MTFCAFSVGRTAPRAWVRVTCSTWRSCRGAPNHSNSHVTNDSWQSLTRVELLCCNSTTSCGPDGEGAEITTTSCGGQESGPQKGSVSAPRPRQDPKLVTDSVVWSGLRVWWNPSAVPTGYLIWWPPPGNRSSCTHASSRFTRLSFCCSGANPTPVGLESPPPLISITHAEDFSWPWHLNRPASASVGTSQAPTLIHTTRLGGNVVTLASPTGKPARLLSSSSASSSRLDGH